MKLILRQLNSMGEALCLRYKFGSWQVLYEKPFDSNIFDFHIKCGRKMTILINALLGGD